MGHNRRWRTLSDAIGPGADYLFRCRACGREVVIERRTFREIASAWGLGVDVVKIGWRSRCGACGNRHNIFEMAAPDMPGRLRLKDGDEMPPKGADLSRWFRMSNSERKRYKRQLRN